MGTVIEDAQDLGRRGFRVHPLKAKDQPYTKYSQTATSDPDAIAALFRPFPNALIAIATGQGLVVVDDDRGNGIDIGLLRECALVSTTPKGGGHYYFACPTPVRNSTSKVAEGIDIRGEGGYVVAPPAVGRQWFKNTGGELTALPGVLLAACLRTEQRSSSFEPRSSVAAGERHDYIVRFAGWAVANELVDSLDDLVITTYEHALQVCDPWPMGELQGVLTHVRDICRWVIERDGGQS